MAGERDLKPVATMTEAEGVSLVLRKEDADRTLRALSALSS